MKIIFLNCWGGRITKPFNAFIKKYSLDADIFCFQEVSPKLFFDISTFLTNYWGFHESGWNLRKDNIWYGQATFIKKEITVTSSGRIPVFKSGKNSGFMQYIFLKKGNARFYVGNVHGKASPWHKLDTKSRLKQSKVIIDFFYNKKYPRIIGGDFNLLPETESIKVFEKCGFRDLIRERQISNTRNRFAWDRWAGDSRKHQQYFADYVFISPDIKVNSFEVPNIEISDHLPMILDFEI